ncbi:hypothetical protein MPSEU_000491400 [Mayamaea pseudoterrestris]|nr:hypothetical protein MPSEU_000491400 [Mayamaea pseudoterrestris]
MAAVAAFREGDKNSCCRSCRTAALRVDWAQGDLICTYCGVVNEEKLLDGRPEWIDYNDMGDDVVKDKARCGLVYVDETKYFGGLQPTCLSKYIHGAPYQSSASIRKTLVRMNRKNDRIMEKMHGKEVEDARVVRAIVAKGRQLESMEHEVRPEIAQMLLQEEEDANRMQVALNANKWSLSRALRLYGSAHEQLESSAGSDCPDFDDEALEAKQKQQLRQCAHDLYQAYTILTMAARTLNFPDRVANEAISILCEYASRRDGIVVRGVSSTLQRKHDAPPTNMDKEVQRRASSALHEYNKLKQAGAIVAAILLYMGRRHSHERSMQEICTSIRTPEIEDTFLDTTGEFIKKKHCAKAMREVEKFFPKVVQSASVVAKPLSLEAKNLALEGSANVVSFVDHILLQLGLPPVAEASIRLLCLYWHRKGRGDAKLSTVCGSMAYFVSSAGTTMKRLASQATRAKKRRRAGETNLECSQTDDESLLLKEGSSPAAADDSEMAKEQRSYEMMRAWDAWQEQVAWSKTLLEIEKCSGSSTTALLEYYRQQLHPCRFELLNVLKESVEGVDDDSYMLRETPLATVLLPQIGVAASLLCLDGMLQ